MLGSKLCHPAVALHLILLAQHAAEKRHQMLTLANGSAYNAALFLHLIGKDWGDLLTGSVVIHIGQQHTNFQHFLCLGAGSHDLSAHVVILLEVLH